MGIGMRIKEIGNLNKDKKLGIGMRIKNWEWKSEWGEKKLGMKTEGMQQEHWESDSGNDVGNVNWIKELDRVQEYKWNN